MIKMDLYSPVHVRSPNVYCLKNIQLIAVKTSVKPTKNIYEEQLKLRMYYVL